MMRIKGGGSRRLNERGIDTDEAVWSYILYIYLSISPSHSECCSIKGLPWNDDSQAPLNGIGEAMGP